MKKCHKFSVMLCLVTFFGANPPANAQSFTCSIGDRPSCLGYGDTVCSSRGMCVEDSAICFDQFTCNYEGFTCKSNLTDLGNDYDGLVGRYNNLLSENKSLLAKYNRLVDDYNELLDTAEQWEDDYREASRKLDEFSSCVLYAETIEDARYCTY